MTPSWWAMRVRTSLAAKTFFLAVAFDSIFKLAMVMTGPPNRLNARSGQRNSPRNVARVKSCSPIARLYMQLCICKSSKQMGNLPGGM